MVVLGAFTLMFMGFGAAYSFAAFFTAFQAEFGASRAHVSLVFSLSALLWFSFGVPGGMLADRFGPRDWHDGPFGVPLIDGCVARLVARNHNRHVEGDHVIMVGEVVHHDAAGGAPLVFHDGRYIAEAVEEPLPPELRTPWR